MSATAQIITVPLFPELSRRFVTLLESLAPTDWERPVSATWRVRDVVAHLVDTSFRRLSTQRDGYQSSGPGPSGNDYDSLLKYLNQLNAEWARAMERLSPRVLMDLVRSSDAQLAKFLAALDPNGAALWPVPWAGESESKNWFDIAREYTEKWHHAQQVFDATERPSTIADRALMYPCLDALMRGLPHGLRNCEAPDGSVVRVTITGDAGGSWTALRSDGGWELVDSTSAPPVAEVTVHQNDAWKLFMKRTTATEATAKFPRIRTSGDKNLCAAVVETVCVMA